MRSTFSRTFFPAAMLLLCALLLVGTSFQMLVKNYLTEQIYEDLESDGSAIAALASAYYTESSLSGKEFYVNLTLANQISSADAVIFDAKGKLILCSDSPFGCDHQGWHINADYVQRVFSSGIAQNAGIFSGLYNEARFVVSVPIANAKSSSTSFPVIALSTALGNL